VSGGQQINSGQGTVLGGPGAEATGEQSAFAQGDAALGSSVRLRSRKVGGGTAQHALAGVVAGLASGALLATPSPTVSGVAFAAGAGDIGKQRTATLAGASSTAAAGSVVGPDGAPSFTDFTLTTTAATGTYPFTIGIACRVGEAADLQTNLSNYQVVVKRRWSGGSIKHAIISGRATLTQNVPLTVEVLPGSSPSGTPLTAASIQAAAPTATISFGGTASLASLLATPVRTWISGPEMVECHYRTAMGVGNLSAWFHVRLFADGRMWVRAIVENGYLDNGSGAVSSQTNQAHIPSVSIGGATVYTNGGATLTNYANTRWSVEGWIGGDPAVTPLHDVAYLRGTGLVPNYGWLSPSAATLNALTQTYTPMARGNLNASMADAGFDPGIGLLPNWEALYVTSGDARAKRAVLANSSHINSFGVVFRSKNTNLAPRPSEFPTWTIEGPGGGGLGFAEPVRGTLAWSISHHPSEGYLAYLLTGDYWHYETMLLQAALCYLSRPTATNGSGLTRLLSEATRTIAWVLRTIGQTCAIYPEGDAIGLEYQTLLAYQYSYWQGRVASAGQNLLGVLNGLEVFNQAYGTGKLAPWQIDFWAQTNGFLSNVEPLSDSTNIIAVRDWMYRWPVGRLGQSGVATEYSFTRAADYTAKVCDTAEFNTTNYYDSFGDVYAGQYGANTTVSNTLLGTSGAAPNLATGYWANLLPAISYAVDHSASGASDAMTRLFRASNWATLRDAGFDNSPVWGVLPLTLPSTPYSLPAVGEAVQIAGNDALDIVPSGWTTAQFQYSLFGSFGGGCYVPTYSAYGAYVLAGTGGHNHPDFTGAAVFDFATGRWARLDNANGVAQAAGGAYTTAQLNGSPAYEVTSSSVPAPPHPYGNLVYMPDGDLGSVLYVKRAAVAVSVVHSTVAHRLDLSTRLWSRYTAAASTRTSDVEANALWDSTRNRWWWVSSAQHNYRSIEYLDRGDAAWKFTGSQSAFPAGELGGYGRLMLHDGMLLFNRGSSLWLYDPDVPATGWVQLTVSGTLPANQNRWARHSNGNYYAFSGSAASSTLTRITPPVSPKTGTWVIDTVALTGVALPARAESAVNHYSRLFYVDSIDCLCWIPGGSAGVYLMKPPA
jgi:hypothetical protein